MTVFTLAWPYPMPRCRADGVRITPPCANGALVPPIPAHVPTGGEMFFALRAFVLMIRGITYRPGP